MKAKATNLSMALVLIQVFLISGFAYTQSAEATQFNQRIDVPDETVERLRQIFEKNAFAARSFRANWLPCGSGYLVMESSQETNSQALVSYDAASGKRTELISASQLVCEEVTGPFALQNYTLSTDGNRVLLHAVAQDDETREMHHWMLERESGKLLKVTAGSNSSISPEGQRILFTDQGNLYVYNLQNEQTTALTNDAIPGSVTYGQASWSPDGSSILFVQTDVSRVRLRSTLDPVDPSYPEVRETRFARVGGTIASLRVGVADAEGKEIRWPQIPIPSEGYYLGEVRWAGSPDELVVEQLNRFRDKRTFFLANINNGTITRIFEETDPAWVVASYRTNLGLEWVDNHDRFLVLSEMDGWRHAYVYSRDGSNKKNITPGNFDIIQRVAVDDAGGWFYYNASPENATQRYLFRVRLDGSGEPEKVTPADQPGTHNYDIAPNGQYAFHTYSTANTPPVTQLVKLPEHEVVRMLEDNKSLREKVNSLQLQPKEFFQVDIGDGIVMDGWMIKPKDFDPSRKYPLFAYVYGEPHLQTVIDSWDHAMAEFHRVIADLGYLVVSIDNRGTPAPKGAAWRRSISGRLGPLSTEEQAEGILELGRKRPYVDLSRVGTWGWSGGGSNTLNALFRRPDVFHTGIAVVPKPQPHLYNAWFQEIYMNTPEVNPDGYKESAPINYAEGLEGNLLIIHGSGETNTHLEIVEGLVDRLIELGKQFDYIAYPHRDHGLREGKGTTLHVRVYIARYLLNHLPPGPR